MRTVVQRSFNGRSTNFSRLFSGLNCLSTTYLLLFPLPDHALLYQPLRVGTVETGKYGALVLGPFSLRQPSQLEQPLRVVQQPSNGRSPPGVAEQEPVSANLPRGHHYYVFVREKVARVKLEGGGSIQWFTKKPKATRLRRDRRSQKRLKNRACQGIVPLWNFVAKHSSKFARSKSRTTIVRRQHLFLAAHTRPLHRASTGPISRR